jgi:hypothetical protein
MQPTRRTGQHLLEPLPGLGVVHAPVRDQIVKHLAAAVATEKEDNLIVNRALTPHPSPKP